MLENKELEMNEYVIRCEKLTFEKQYLDEKYKLCEEQLLYNLLFSIIIALQDKR